MTPAPVQFIAEVSSNHSRDIERALEFIDRAADVGCHAVKFQLFRIDQLFAPEILEKSEQHRRRKQWELPLEFLPALAQRCRERGLQFGCTPFYLAAVAELESYVDFYKIASYELLWNDLLAACATTGKPVILSTGMATQEEVQAAVAVLHGYGCADPTLLHCTSAYPTPYREANLAAIETLRQATGCRIGWSDHTVDPGVIHRAIHRWGAEVVEFHLDLDGSGDEYASGHCWLPQQIGPVIEQVRHALAADGDGIKEPVAAEQADRLWRADPIDGLRPLRSIRAGSNP
jgi:N-acetylneuraminate synthase